MSGCNECCDTAPVKLGVEDLTLGCGTEEQMRNCRKVKITKVNADNIPFCVTNKSISDYLVQLRRMFPYIECEMGMPLVNYGTWEDAIISADVNSCAIGLPDTVDQRIPLEEGSIVIHNGCVWISLVPDNIVEPSEASQNDGQWLCLSQIDGRLDSLVLRVDALETSVGDLVTRVNSLEQCCSDVTGALGDTIKVLRVDNRLYMTSDGSTPTANVI